MPSPRLSTLAIFLALWFPALGAAALDQEHKLWSALLQKRVKVFQDGQASEVDYEGLNADKEAFARYLKELSAVSKEEFDQWTEKEKLSFLINVYNAFTIKIVLDHLRPFKNDQQKPLNSIKEICQFEKCGWFGSVWRISFIPLFSKKVSLDQVEHEMIGKWFREPRTHFAVNCASVSCPALRNEAYRGKDLERQLSDATRKFLSDRSRNRYIAEKKILEISSIFKWYERDFTRASGSLIAFLGQHMTFPKETTIKYLDYNWSLNRQNHKK